MSSEGLLNLACHRPELPKCIVLQHKRDSECCQNSIQGIAAQQWTQNRQVNRCAEECDDEGSDDECNPEVAGGSQRNYAYVSTKHEQFAMGKIHHVHDTKDQREPGCDQRQD